MKRGKRLKNSGGVRQGEITREDAKLPRPKFVMVPRQLWQTPPLRQRTDDAKLLLLYLLTSWHAAKIPGIVLVSPLMIVDDLGWENDALGRVERALRELEGTGWISIDGDARMVFIPCALDVAVPQNRNMIIGWSAAWRELPQNSLKAAWVEHAARVIATWAPQLRDVFLKQFSNSFETVSEPFPKIETEIEKETEKEDAPPPASPATTATEEKSNDSVQHIREVFNKALQARMGDQYKPGQPWNARQIEKVLARVGTHGEAETGAIVAYAVETWDRAIAELDGRLGGEPGISAICGGFFDHFRARRARRSERDRGEYRPAPNAPPVGW